MRVIANTRLIESRAGLARNLSLVGLVILFGGLLVTLLIQAPIRLPLGTSGVLIEPVVLAWAALLVGFILSQVALYFGNRYGARWRPDQLIDAELRSLDNRYTVLHFTKGVTHVLLAPSGAYVLEVKHHGGRIRFENGRWRHDLPLKWLRQFFQEGLGNPGRDAQIEAEGFARLLGRLELADALPVRPLIVFVNPGAQVEAEGAPVPATHVNKLKGLIRALEQGTPARVSNATLNRVSATLAGDLVPVDAAAMNTLSTDTTAEAEPPARPSRAAKKSRKVKSGKR